jgi:NAD+ synthase (glutamine-hydrolysing)
MRVAMAQVNSTVGDLEGNARKIRDVIDEAAHRASDLVAFPELAVTGYPPQDLLAEKAFVKGNKEALSRIIAGNPAIAGIIGFVDSDRAGRLFNAAAVFEGTKLVAVVRKTLLPTYDVFDEDRYFKPAERDEIQPVRLDLSGRRVRVGVEICEDLWDEQYEIKVTDLLVARGAEVVVNISSSPFYSGKRFERRRLLGRKARRNRVPIFYINLVGGQDELVFDGQSLAVDASGRLIAAGQAFEEDLVLADVDPATGRGKRIVPPPYDREEEMFNALVLGVRDYFRKTGFHKAILGLSGGIDSSLTACIAVAALGPDNVVGVSMPARFSSPGSKADATELAKNLDLAFVRFPIQAIVASYQGVLRTPLEQVRKRFRVSIDRDDPVADENIQPRVRGNCLMDISNRLQDLGILVLNTGNKTELALGYCTLYGDMSGGLGALGDVSKLDVYRLAEFVNRKAGRDVIPRNVLDKKPSPELKENQVDPFDFDIVSPLVDEIIENRRSPEELAGMGYPADIVADIRRRIRRAEYKRWQAPPCIKITRKAFGIGWKMPIVNKYAG